MQDQEINTEGDYSVRGKAKGAHQVNKLSDAEIRKLTTAGSYSDGGGLWLQVDAPDLNGHPGKKRWFLRLTVHGRRRELGLGGYPLFSLKDARERARERREEAAKGGDVMTLHRRGRDKLPTFEALAREAFAARAKGDHSKADKWIRQMELHAFPKIGALPINLVTKPRILEVIKPLWQEKADTARDLKQNIAQVIRWACAHDYLPGSEKDIVDLACVALPPQGVKVKHHAAVFFEHAPEFIQALRSYQAYDEVRRGLEFLILTGARNSEVRFAVWQEINFEAKTWTIPKERMKTRKLENRADHVVPLSPRCLEILSEMKATGSNSPFIFRSVRTESGVISDNTFAKLVRIISTKLGYGHATAHGMRAMFRTWSSEKTNFLPEVCEMALAHAINDKIVKAYNRATLLDKRRALMEAWEDYLNGKTAAGTIPTDIAVIAA